MHKHYYTKICQLHLSLLSKNFFQFAPDCKIDTRNKFAKLTIPICITNVGHEAISFAGPSQWNSLAEFIKKSDNLSTLKRVW